MSPSRETTPLIRPLFHCRRGDNCILENTKTTNSTGFFIVKNATDSTDYGQNEVVIYYQIVPLKRHHLSYKAIFFLQKGRQLYTGKYKHYKFYRIIHKGSKIYWLYRTWSEAEMCSTCFRFLLRLLFCFCFLCNNVKSRL